MKQTLKIGFIGLGLIGGSIARAIRHYHPDSIILAHTRSHSTIDFALKENMIDAACDQVDQRFCDCDYIFLCAPVEANASYLGILKNLIHPDCIITDVGSTKTDIHRHVCELGLEAQFIGGHPMAGSEKTGIINSKRHLLENAYYIVTPTSSVPQEKVDAYIELIRSLKALPLVLDYQEHDFVTGAISHLPHLIAAALVNLVHDEDTPSETMKLVAAGGFKDITRIASSSPEMWEQICMTNSGNILKVLDAYIHSLQNIRSDLEQKNGAGIYSLFQESREYRNSFSDLSAGPIKKVYRLYCDLVDEAGGIAILSTILASRGITLKNIGIVHNREFEDAVLLVEFYDEESMAKAAQELRRYHYTIYEK